MADERVADSTSRDWRPIPDPTVLTTEQLGRAVQAERDYVIGQLGIVNERLRGIDTATELLNETVNRVPTDVTTQVTHLRELMEEKFDSIGKQFKERDTRSERESRDNKVAVDAAFAAQKDAAAQQNTSNSLAITKSEIATTETINKLSELFKTATEALGDKLDDVKERVARLETERKAVVAYKDTSRLDVGMVLGIIGALVGIASVVIFVILSK